MSIRLRALRIQYDPIRSCVLEPKSRESIASMPMHSLGKLDFVNKDSTMGRKGHRNESLVGDRPLNLGTNRGQERDTHTVVSRV